MKKGVFSIKYRPLVRVGADAGKVLKVKTPLDAARAYLAKLPPAISGAGGHAAAFAAACRTVRLGLSDSDALALLLEYNRRCLPSWTEKELAHKLHDARRVAGCQVRTFQQPRPAVRVVWKVERKAVKATEPVATQAPPEPAPAPAEPKRPAPGRPDATASLPHDRLPWLTVAAQILAGEFDGADRSTIESLRIGLHRIPHSITRLALARLQTHAAAE
jgi:hypothetical protein